MTRSTLDSINRAEAGAPSLRLVYFAKVAFPSGTIYATTAGRDFGWDGKVWSAQWIVMQLPTVTETPDLKPNAGELVFGGLDAALRTKIVNDKYHYAELSCWKGFCDEAWKLKAAPHRIAKRFLSQCVLRVNGKTGTVAITAHGPEVMWRRDSVQLATPESQKLRYPADTGLDRVLAQGTKVIEWGAIYVRGGAAGVDASIGADRATGGPREV